MIKLSCQKTISYKEVFHMNSITQELKYKQSIVKYALRYVSTKCRQIFYLSDNPLILLPKSLYIFQSSLNKTN